LLKSEDCPFGIDRLFHEFPLSMRPVQKVVGQTVVVRVSGFLFQVFVSGFGFKKSWFYPSCFLFQVFCFKFLVSGFGLKSCGSNYRGSCFVFQVSSFGFRVQKVVVQPVVVRVSCFRFLVSGFGSKSRGSTSRGSGFTLVQSQQNP